MNPPVPARITAGKVNGKTQQAMHAAAASAVMAAAPAVMAAALAALPPAAFWRGAQPHPGEVGEGRLQDGWITRM